VFFFFFQAEDGIRDRNVTGVQTCALPISKVGEITYDIAKNVVDDYIQVHEGAVCSTILDMYSKQAIIAEPAGALSVSALEQYRSEIKGKTVVCVVSGGNNDINRMKE